MSLPLRSTDRVERKFYVKIIFIYINRETVVDDDENCSLAYIPVYSNEAFLIIIYTIIKVFDQLNVFEIIILWTS